MTDTRDMRDDDPDMRKDRMDMRNDAMEHDTPTRDASMTRDDEIRREDMRARDREGMRERDDMAREPFMATNRSEADMWPDMGDLRQRFDAIQSEFIDDPKGAVKKAEGLINEVVERITRSMRERMDTMHRGADKTSDTEQLRQTMRGYRELVVWMETRRAA